MKHRIHARKSTESEERQILSIESQISELREFAPVEEKLEIVRASLCERPKRQRTWANEIRRNVVII